VSRPTLEGDRAPRLPDYSRDDAKWLAEALEHRPLLDVKLEKGLWKLRQAPAPHRPRLLGPEGDYDERRLAEAIGGLDRRDDS